MRAIVRFKRQPALIQIEDAQSEEICAVNCLDNTPGRLDIGNILRDRFARCRPPSRNASPYLHTPSFEDSGLNSSCENDVIEHCSIAILWEDHDLAFGRTWRVNADGTQTSVLIVLSAGERPTAASLDRLLHEYRLKAELGSAWAVRPLDLLRQGDRTVLVLEDPGGEPLERLLGTPLQIDRFLPLAIGIASAVRHAHQQGLVHGDLKPAHFVVDEATGSAWLTGFGLATRLPRGRETPEPPVFLAGTLAYMAPEQTGRMNRSIDTRSDLYSLGVTLYQMLTGSLPFIAFEPMEWIHCHIARKPVSPDERLGRIPAQISAIVMKLLAKTAGERYQTAVGLEQDLRRCLTQWETQGRLDPFSLGERDIPGRLLIPERLYGRDREIAKLLAAFDRVVHTGSPELVLVSGYSGIGKSSIVNELHKVLAPPRGLFAAGKFDQYKRDIPYSTLAQALQNLVRPLLGRSEDDLRKWRDAFREALGPNGRLLVDLVPELKLILDEQPPVPELPPQQAQSRFRIVFRRFIGVFARPNHPLALFLDDLQWLDAATLDLIADLLTQSDVRHLMLIGAYRDNEADAQRPLIRRLNAMKVIGAKVEEITLAPISCEDLKQLTADALCCDLEQAAPLAHLVHSKTGGNPFFAIQFLQALAEAGLLSFDHGSGCWSWELEGVRALGYTDNVAELMVGKLIRLPLESQKALQEFACLGNVATPATLGIVHGTSSENVHEDLREAVHLGLVDRLQGEYRFAHDRIQEAAYSLIAEESRAEAHLRIGRLLVAHTPQEKREGAIFEIVNQLNRAIHLITSREEREQLAEFNLIAGRRAKASTAYASALNYLVAGETMLGDDGYDHRPDLMFALELERSECEFLTGEAAAADERLVALSNCASNAVERAKVACLRMSVCTTLNRNDRAITVALDYLRRVGIDWSPHPTAEQARREYEQIWARLGNRPVEDLIDLPLMTDPESRATVEVLAKVWPPALFTDANLASLTICRAVNLSLERGNCDASCLAYAGLGRIAGPRFGDYQAGFRFGQLGYELVERRGLVDFQARTLHMFSFVERSRNHVRSSVDLLRRTFEVSNRIGDLLYAAFACNNLNAVLLFAGDPLADVQCEAEHGLAFLQRAGYGLVVDAIVTQLALIRMLRGLTPEFGRLDDELAFEHHLHADPVFAIDECWYWVRKMQARYLAGDYAAAVNAASKAQPLLWVSASFSEEAEFHFYGALSLAAYCEQVPPGERQQHLASLAVHQERLAVWAKNCPENFENRLALVSAEIARLEKRELDAERLYEQAIRSARANDFVHNEALANELAARFYAARGFERIAQTYLHDARHCYLRWGAHGKVRHLDATYPHFQTEASAYHSTNTVGTAVEHLDLGTVIKVSQAVSREIVLEKLIDTLMRTAIEQAGAERGLLILSEGDDQRVEAEATTAGDAVFVQLCDRPVAAAMLPQTVLNHVLRTLENVIVNDACADSWFKSDPYIVERQARSILCLPLISQAELIGVLYLENNLTSGVFAPARMAVLKLIASQAAITLENARLYQELAQREAKIRRLVDANIVGIFVWDCDGRILDANDAFLGMVGYDRKDLVSGRLRWTDLTPAEWLDHSNQRWVPGLHMTGTLEPVEKEYFHKDGSRVPVLVGLALFEERGSQGVAFVLDLTERKKAEAEARESERRYREAQMELAHANRAATMGQLTASITHEIKQPIAATQINALAALRWLDARPPNQEEVRLALGYIIDDSKRAGHIIGRIRDLFKKTPPRKDTFDINEAISEVIELTHGEAVKHSVRVSTTLGERSSNVVGDRVQIQQVILNLMVNAIESMSAASGGPRHLLISTAADLSNDVSIAVEDSGPGLPTQDIERIFDPFYTTKPGGLGMGLSICRSIVEAHGGRLLAVPNMPRGAKFQFTVPARPRSGS
jgi:PAS domain S-box-containing protein